jgi:transposase
MVEWVRDEPVVSPDETGWKVAGELKWLWVFATPALIVYSIASGRGFEHAAAILGEDFSGTLARDGWAPYRKFLAALHQTCLAHITRRNDARLATAERGAARVPRALERILDHAFALRERRDAGELTEQGLRVAVGKLEARLARLLAWQPTDPENARLLKHLAHEAERGALFTFLLHPEVPATNYRAEQAIRPAVVTRKVCGGNRSWRGAHTQEVLASLFATAQLRGRDALGLLAALLCAPEPAVALELRPEPRTPRPLIPP